MRKLILTVNCYVSQLSHVHMVFLFIRNTYEFVRVFFKFVSNWLSPLTIPKCNIIEDCEFALPCSFRGLGKKTRSSNNLRW